MTYRHNLKNILGMLAELHLKLIAMLSENCSFRQMDQFLDRGHDKADKTVGTGIAPSAIVSPFTLYLLYSSKIQAPSIIPLCMAVLAVTFT